MRNVARGVGLFDSLRGKLKGVSKKLEDELDKQLGDRLEQEIAAAKQALPDAQHPSPEPNRAPTGAATPRPEAKPEPRSGQESDLTSTRSATVAPPQVDADPRAPHEPERDHHARLPAQPDAGAPAPPAPPSAPSESSARPATSSPASPSAGQVATPTLVATPARDAPTPAPRPAPATTGGPPKVTGKKQLTPEEIERRVLAELEQAVAVQKDVETAVGATGKAGKFTINEKVLDEILWDLEVALLESDVALPVIEAIKADVREQLLTLSVAGDAQAIVEKVLRSAVRRVLQVAPLDFDAFVKDKLASGKKPVVVMFVGVNGTGKTTSIGRVAYRLQQQGRSCVLAAGDTFRAGAIEQLALHGERLGITVIKHKAGADPAAVAYDAIEHAKARHKDVVLLDTAGRMQNNRALMDEMDKIRRVANPDLCIFVGDSLAGNDAVEQARKFDEVVDVGGIILTKVDVDAKGGAALSVAYTINKPLLFVGVGQNYPDLRPFDADWMVQRLFGATSE